MQTENERVTRNLRRKHNKNSDTCKKKKGERFCSNRKRGETAEKKKNKISHSRKEGKKISGKKKKT
jgi:hypothetical protein